MTVDLPALAKLASEATMEAWDYWSLTSWDEGTGDQAGMMRPAPYTTAANAAYIAAASPDVVAALCRVALAAKAFMEEEIAWGSYGRHEPYLIYAQLGEKSTRAFRDALEALR